MSEVRKIYFLRLIGRIGILIFSIYMLLFHKDSFHIILGWNFFKELSIWHILWFIWVFDMLYQLIPAKKHISLGSQKHFIQRFKPMADKINYHALKEYITSTTKSAYKVFILWVLLLLAIGILYMFGVIDREIIFVLAIVFFVCDLICVLIWCPFRLIMKNKCCTTCRIFNWDHLMMFSPFVFIPSFYTTSLLCMSFVVWVVWEACVMMYPERFWEMTNTALQCSECTDKLCTQYCQKLRK